MATMKKNDSLKAFTSWLAKNYREEWLIGVNNNAERGPVYDAWKLYEMFDRYGENSDGCSKAVHFLKYIVIKRHQPNGYIPEIRNSRGTGNQLIDEINCYKLYAECPEADLLCPILKYYTSKSDKVSATSKTMQRNVLIVAQRAVKVGNAKYACRKAEELNREHGYHGETAAARFRKLEKFSESQNWRDALYNDANSGVIFDYHKNCYKAVFIDYAL